MILKILILWIICGFLAYGISKWHVKKMCKEGKYFGHDIKTEVFCLGVGVLGFYGLLVIVLLSIMTERKIGFCFKMPKELKRGHEERK